MQAADTPEVEQAIQIALASSSATTLWISSRNEGTPLTVNDARSIIACLLENPRFDTLFIRDFHILDAVLNVFRNGLPLCTSVTKVTLVNTHLGNEGLDRLRPAFYNTSVTMLNLSGNNGIQGHRGGEVLQDLLVGNDTLLTLVLRSSRFGPEVAIGLGKSLVVNNRLQNLYLNQCYIGNEGVANLLPADVINNNSLLHLDLSSNRIEGADGSGKLTLLLQRFLKLKVLCLNGNYDLGPLGARALAPGLAAANQLEVLDLSYCGLGNDGVANLIPDGQVNVSLTHLELRHNDIEGADGGRQVSLLLQRFPQLKVLRLNYSNLGPLGARALAPGLATASHLESLVLQDCGLGNDGVANLIPDGQVNTSLTNLRLGGNDIQGHVGGEIVIALASRCTNLDSIDLWGIVLSLDQRRRLKLLFLSPDQRHRLDLLLDRKRLCTAAQALGGSPFSILFRAVEEAHRHEHGLSAIFVILQNDGEDYFCTANNNAIE